MKKRDVIAGSVWIVKVALLAATVWCSSAVGAELQQAMTAFSAGKADVVISQDGEDYLRVGLAAWGPNWAWTGFDGPSRGEQGSTLSTLSAKLGGKGVPVHLTFQASQPAPHRLVFDYQLEAAADTELTLIAIELTPGQAFEGREVTLFAGEIASAVPCPFGRRMLGRNVERVEMINAQGSTTVLRFDPPAQISSDGAAHIELAANRLAAKQAPHLTMTVELPGATDWYPSVADIPDEPGIDTWYPWQGTSEDRDSLTSLGDWIDRPAGQHGRIVRRGKDLFYNNAPMKLWGLNLCYSACAPDKELADRRATFYRKHGVNSVRLHKYADGPGWAGIQSEASFVELDPEGLDRMDYQISRFKEAGIYVKLSAHFGTPKLGRDDVQYVPYLEEFGTLDDRPAARCDAPQRGPLFTRTAACSDSANEEAAGASKSLYGHAVRRRSGGGVYRDHQ